MAKVNTLADYRKKNNLTQEELAEKVGVTKVYISQIENGHRKPSIRLAERLASTLKTKWQNIYNYPATK